MDSQNRAWGLDAGGLARGFYLRWNVTEGSKTVKRRSLIWRRKTAATAVASVS